MKKSLTTLGAVGATAATAGGALAAWGYTELTHFELHRYHLPILAPGTLRGEEEFRILHLSDLHMIPGQQAKIDLFPGWTPCAPTWWSTPAITCLTSAPSRTCCAPWARCCGGQGCLFWHQ